MPNSSAYLSPSAVILEAERLLASGGYRVSRDGHRWAGSAALSLLAEDLYGIVGLAIWESWDALKGGWPDAQGSLVDLLSERFARAEPKLWDAYLVLLCVLPAGPDNRSVVDRIRYDMSRIRKLVATGEDLATLKDIERVLLPLLPLRVGPVGDTTSAVIDSLPAILAGPDLPQGTVEAVVRAFKSQQPLLESVLNYEESK